MITYKGISSPLGTLLAVCEDDAITALLLPNQAQLLPRQAQPGTTPILEAVEVWLSDYFAGNIPEITFPLAPKGTPFQQSVWALLRKIPYGKSVTYGDLARQLGRVMSAQAVGQAVGKNPLSILIPCHRVLGAEGKLTGYAGGLDAKRNLLDLEGISYR
jgi:methylated-DNA-[protein]-cysteine S-methyltransferase